MRLFQRIRHRLDVDEHGAAEFLVQYSGDPDLRVGGCLPRAEPVGSVLPLATVPPVPRSEWITGESLRSYERRDLNQNGYPACCLASLCNGMELAMVRDGRPHRPLDWKRAWKTLSGGRGGVALAVAARFAMDKGIPTEDGEHVVRIVEAWDIETLDQLGSAYARGAICTFGHDVHAECGTRLVLKNGAAYIDTRNSWGRNWGEAGWHLFPLDEVEINTYSAIVVGELELLATDVSAWKDGVLAV